MEDRLSHSRAEHIACVWGGRGGGEGGGKRSTGGNYDEV